MSDNFAPLSKEFNQTAQAIGAGEGNWQMAVAKFMLLMRHKTETPVQKQDLSSAMLDAAINRLEKVHKSIPAMDQFTPSTLEALYGVFRPLASPEVMPHLPRDASERISNVTLDLVRTLEDYKKRPDTTLESYNNVRKNYTDFSFFMLETAQAVKASEESRKASAETQSDLTLGKPANVKSRLSKPS